MTSQNTERLKDDLKTMEDDLTTFHNDLGEWEDDLNTREHDLVLRHLELCKMEDDLKKISKKISPHMEDENKIMKDDLTTHSSIGKQTHIGPTSYCSSVNDKDAEVNGQCWINGVSSHLHRCRRDTPISTSPAFPSHVTDATGIGSPLHCSSAIQAQNGAGHTLFNGTFA